MVLQNGDAGRSSPGAITPEAYSAETVSIQQEPRRKQTPRPVLDSYYIEFPSLDESYSLPRKDVDTDEPLPPPDVPLPGEKHDVLPTKALQQQQQQPPPPHKSSVMLASATTAAAVLGLRRSQPRSASNREVIGKNAEHGGGGIRRTASSVSHRRPNQPPPHGRSSAASRAAPSASAVLGSTQPRPHRSKPPLAVHAADMPRPTPAPFSSSAAGLKSSAPLTRRPAVAGDSARSLARLASKPWKDLEDCGVACFLRPAAECHSLSEQSARCPSGLDVVAGTEEIAVTDAPAVASARCDEPEHCFGTNVGQQVAGTAVVQAAVGATGLDSRASLGPNTDGSDGHCRMTCGADTLYCEAAATSGSTPIYRAGCWPKPCRCHLSWYSSNCHCTALGSSDCVALEECDDDYDDDVDCWVLCHRDGAGERDIQSCWNDQRLLQPCESSQEASDRHPPAGCDDIWAAAASRLMGTFVHPDRSESLATAVLKGCTAAASESAAAAAAAEQAPDSAGSSCGHGTSSEWPSAAESFAACTHPCYHYEIFLEADCDPFAAHQQKTRHSFYWTRYADRPPWTVGDAIDGCENVGSSSDCTGWPPPQPEPEDRCLVCGCDVHAGTQLLHDADVVAASLEQLLLQCLSQPPAEVELQPASADGRKANDVETVVDSAEVGCCVSGGTNNYGAL